MGTPKYVVLDGMDGSGKGTQIALLRGKLHDSAIFTREPGGAPLAEEIRKIIRDNPLAGESTALFHFLSFWAAREESLHKLVMPALKSGKHVFSDRGDSSTFAFQLYGEENKELFPMFMQLRQEVFSTTRGRSKPNLYIVFDLPADVARERALHDASRAKTHFDVRDLAYYERVGEGFREFAKCGYGLVEFIDATETPEEVHRSVMRVLVSEMIAPELGPLVF